MNVNPLIAVALVVCGLSIAVPARDLRASSTANTVAVQRASLLEAEVNVFRTRAGERGQTAWILVVSAEMPDSCRSLQLVPADDPLTPAFELAALQVNRSPDGPCLQALRDDVRAIEFVTRVGGGTVRILGRNRTLAVNLPLPQTPR